MNAALLHPPCINPRAVRAYDIRGVVGRDLDTRDAHNLGIAYATAARARGARRIGVGRDGRNSSPELERALIGGLVAGGMSVFRTGLGPTPQLYFALNEWELDGGIMVTGSHNPPDQNGFKIVLGPEPVYGEALHELVGTHPCTTRGGKVCEVQPSFAYTARLAELVPELKSLHVVWDCGNGAVGAVIDALVQHLPGEHVLLNAAVDGTFPVHHPDPAVAANLDQLRATVVAQGADLGIAFDGDGDRIGVVDHTGRVIWADQLVLLLADDLLSARPGATVVADVKSSQLLFDGVTARGGRAVMAPSGYVLIRAIMLRERALLAGEMSGHIICGDNWCRVDDALYVALRVLAALSRRAGCLADFRDTLPAASSTPEIRLACAESMKARVIDEVAQRLMECGSEVDRTDGLRVRAGAGWWLLRASGTESKLALRCESADGPTLCALCEEVAEHLRRNGLDPSELEAHSAAVRAASGGMPCAASKQ
jgi:phosphomannomutase